MDFQVVLDGVAIEGLLHASLVNSNCFSADSYSLTFALGPPPLSALAFWSSLSSAYVEIGIIVANGLISQTLMTGTIDGISADPIQGTVTIEGRDLTSVLVDSYRQQDFVNQTASEIVSAVALFHNLIPVVTATTSIVGRYYGDGYTRLSIGQFSRLRSDWDLIVELARECAFDVFVQGRTLCFQPSSTLGILPVRLPLETLKMIRFERNLTIQGETTAMVQSWDSQYMTAYGSSGGSATGSTATPAVQPFLFSASNFTAQQVADSAQRYSTELNRLSVTLHAEMPLEPLLMPRTVILIDQTDSLFDTVFQIDSIERHYDSTCGSTQIIRGILA